MRIYAKTAASNCIYLYLGAQSQRHGKLFREVYDPDNSTQESVDAAKKLYGDERQRYKVCVLALAYGGGVGALDRMFKKYGMVVPESELRELIKLFRKTFPGLPRFTAQLQVEYEQNGGYITTGRGRPLAIPRDKLRDVIAYFCQATGHDYVMRWVYHMSEFRRRHKLNIKPFLPDFHDASYWVCPDNPSDIAAGKAMFDYAYDSLNEELGLDVSFKGATKTGYTFEIK
jgi:hypothetical protein